MRQVAETQLDIGLFIPQPRCVDQNAPLWRLAQINQRALHGSGSGIRRGKITVNAQLEETWRFRDDKLAVG